MYVTGSHIVVSEMGHCCVTIVWLNPSSPSVPSGGVHVIQDVEQARPGDQSEEALQLKLAIQLSKQQAENEEKLRSVWL